MPFDGPTGSQLDAPHFCLFVDRNSGGRLFKSLVEAAGIEVHLHDELFRSTLEDPEWLARLGESGWLLVSGDYDTTRSPLFLQQLADSRAHVFVLLALNGESAEGKAAVILGAYRMMCTLAAETEPPAIWRIGKDGIARPFAFRRTLDRMKRGRRV